MHSLDRLLLPAEPPRIEERTGTGQPQWLSTGVWRIFVRPADDASDGDEVERFSLPGGGTIAARWRAESGAVSVPFSLAEAYENYVSERWKMGVDVKQLTPGQLSLFYRLRPFIPRSAQLLLRRTLIKWQGLPAFPRWPLDESVVQLLRFYARCLLIGSRRDELSFRWFWPDGFDAALVLTHDVESEAGLRNALRIADLEEARGFRSSFNIVAAAYPVDHGVLRELRERGFEVGIHGLRHDRSMFESKESFQAEQPRLHEAVTILQASGFRAPSTHRIFELLGELPVSYDCTMPNSDPFEPQPGGCCSVWPFFIGPVVELPYTMPQDHTLFTLLGHRSANLWLRQLERIEALNGLAQVVSHPDPGYLGDSDKCALYAEFLEFARARPTLWKPRPADVAKWWRERETDGPRTWPVARGVVRFDDGGQNVVLERAPAGRGG